MGESQSRVNSLSWTSRALVWLSVALFIVIHWWELNKLLFIPSLLACMQVCARTVSCCVCFYSSKLPKTDPWDSSSEGRKKNQTERFSDLLIHENVWPFVNTSLLTHYPSTLWEIKTGLGLSSTPRVLDTMSHFLFPDRTAARCGPSTFYLSILLSKSGLLDVLRVMYVCPEWSDTSWRLPLIRMLSLPASNQVGDWINRRPTDVVDV